MAVSSQIRFQNRMIRSDTLSKTFLSRVNNKAGEKEGKAQLISDGAKMLEIYKELSKSPNKTYKDINNAWRDAAAKGTIKEDSLKVFVKNTGLFTSNEQVVKDACARVSYVMLGALDPSAEKFANLSTELESMPIANITRECGNALSKADPSVLSKLGNVTLHGAVFSGRDKDVTIPPNITLHNAIAEKGAIVTIFSGSISARNDSAVFGVGPSVMVFSRGMNSLSVAYHGATAVAHNVGNAIAVGDNHPMRRQSRASAQNFLEHMLLRVGMLKPGGYLTTI